MGIKNINKLLKNKCKKSITINKLNILSGKTIAIDISIYLYRFVSFNKENYLNSFVKQIIKFYKYNIIPFYVFDGKPPKLKKDVLDNRKEYKTNILNKINKLKENNKINNEKLDKLEKLLLTNNTDKKDINEKINKIKKNILSNNNKLDKNDKKYINITPKIINKCKELFDHFGVPYITANGEAEALCSKLCSNNLVYGVLSEDYDVLPFGSNIFIKNFNIITESITIYNLKSILTELKLNQSQFIDMCILCGCDYCPKIYNIGPEKSYKIILKYKSIEQFIKNNKKYIIPDNFDYIQARYLFKTNYDNTFFNNIKSTIHINKPNIDNILLCIKNNKLNISQKSRYIINNKLIINFNNIINHINVKYESKSKPSYITDFFK